MLKEFQSMTSVYDDSSLSSLIQPLETLPVELTGTYTMKSIFINSS